MWHIGYCIDLNSILHQVEERCVILTIIPYLLRLAWASVQ